MSVSILVVDDETDVADLFRQHFRREVRQGVYVLHFACSADNRPFVLSKEVHRAFDHRWTFRRAAVRGITRRERSFA